MSIRLTLISRRDCHLCEEMAAVVAQVAAQCAADVETCDVDADPALRARFDTEVPVLLIGGRKAFKYRVTAAELVRRLQAERRRATARSWRAWLLGGRRLER